MSSPSPRTLLVSFSPVLQASGGNLVREIDDPCGGDRWLLVRDPSRPGGPGRLFQVSAVRRKPLNPGHAGPEIEAPAPVIHPGDRILVEENTPVVEARLEAVAMGPAQPGSTFTVRLAVGGRVVRVVAVGPGRAVFPEEVAR